MSRPAPSTPSWYPTVQGDLVSRVNLLRWIREWARAHEIYDFEYFEFGVLNGESLTEAIRQLRGGLRRVTGFDTFEGIPALADADKESLESAPSFTAGQYAGLSGEAVRASVLAATNFPLDDLSLVAGDFRETLAGGVDVTPKYFPLVFHLDCDLYSSSVSALEWCAEHAQDGSWLLADDYWCYRGNPRMGQRRAIRDVIESHPRVELTSYTNYRGFGRAFIFSLR